MRKEEGEMNSSEKAASFVGAAATLRLVDKMIKLNGLEKTLEEIRNAIMGIPEAEDAEAKDAWGELMGFMMGLREE